MTPPSASKHGSAKSPESGAHQTPKVAVVPTATSVSSGLARHLCGRRAAVARRGVAKRARTVRMSTPGRKNCCHRQHKGWRTLRVSVNTHALSPSESGHIVPGKRGRVGGASRGLPTVKQRPALSRGPTNSPSSRGRQQNIAFSEFVGATTKQPRAIGPSRCAVCAPRPPGADESTRWLAPASASAPQSWRRPSPCPPAPTAPASPP